MFLITLLGSKAAQVAVLTKIYIFATCAHCCCVKQDLNFQELCLTNSVLVNIAACSKVVSSIMISIIARPVVQILCTSYTLCINPIS